MQRLGHGAEIDIQAPCHRRRDPDDVRNFLCWKLHQASTGDCRRGGANRAGAMPAGVPPALGGSTKKPGGDLGGDDEGRQHLGRGGPRRFGNRQDRRNDAGDRLGGRVEVEIHGVTRHAIRQGRKLRRSPQRPAHDRGDRRRALKLDDIADDISGRRLAAGEHHPDSVNECDPSALDDDGRRALEIEASNEVSDGLARCPGRRFATHVGPARSLLLRQADAGQPEQGRGARAEENSAVERVAVIFLAHHRLPRPC